MSLTDQRCDSLFEPLKVLGFEVRCERRWDHRPAMHQTTDEKGRRTQWAWTIQERNELAQATK